MSVTASFALEADQQVLVPGLDDNPARKETPWGKDDQIGATNQLTPEGALEAVKLVKSGKVYSLGAETGEGRPAFEGSSTSW